MAKVFRTETLSVGADKIRLTADSGGNFSFKNSGGSDVFGSNTIGSDIASLNSKVSSATSARSSAVGATNTDIEDETNLRGSDVHTLVTARQTAMNSAGSDLESAINTRTSAVSTKDGEIDDEINSRGSDVHTLITARQTAMNSAGSDLESAISARTSAVSSTHDDIETLETTRTNHIASIAAKIGSEDVFAKTFDLSGEQGSDTFQATWTTSEFNPDTNPIVCGMLRGKSDSDPILGVMLSGTQSSKTTAEFVFSDALPSATYELEILASKAP